MIRQPIICVMGHVDHGKTTLLDKIRNTSVAAKEAGGITQHIGASEVPIGIVKAMGGKLLERFNTNLVIPGLLFIDTPGHEAFTNLRRRGGSVADLAVLVVDVSKSFEPQTYEAIDILREYKTPFIVAANKIDLITGWRSTGSSSFLEAVEKQTQNVVNELDARVYDLIGKLSELGFNSERFDRVKNFQKEIAIMPISAKTGEGIAELLVYITGLAQKYLEARLNIEENGPGIGSIIEKREERGLGVTIDVILYNGMLKVNDIIAFGTETGVKTAKIKALFRPKALQELRESAGRFYSVESVSAAAGVKISGNDLDEALPGSLVMSTSMPNYKSEIEKEMSDVFSVSKEGIVLRADTIGGLEAISRLLKNENVSISKKGLGNVTRRDVLDAMAMKAIDPYSAVILSFNVGIEADAREEAQVSSVSVINESVIYRLIEEYKKWVEDEKKREKENAEKSFVFPGAIKVIPNACFRVSHPAIFGVSVIEGRIKPGYRMIDENGETVGRIKEIQDNGVSLGEAMKNTDVAISMDEVVYGRGVKENEILYTYVDDEYELLFRQQFGYLLNDDEKRLLDQISEIKEKAKKI